MEEREVGSTDHVPREGRAGVLGGTRVQQYGRPVERRSLRILTCDSRQRKAKYAGPCCRADGPGRQPEVRRSAAILLRASGGSEGAPEGCRPRVPHRVRFLPSLQVSGLRGEWNSPVAPCALTEPAGSDRKSISHRPSVVAPPPPGRGPHPDFWPS